jgi:glycosyltransferase involved in cell wall biosynthesis
MSKYLWIAHEGNYTGANRAALEFSDVLVRSGHQVAWLLPSNGTFHKVLLNKGYDVNIIGFYNWTFPMGSSQNIGRIIKTSLRNVKSIFLIARYIWRGSFDCVVSNTICFYVGAVGALMNRTKHIWVIHEFGEEDHGIKPWVGTRGYRWLGKLSVKVIVNSEAVKEKFLKFVGAGKLSVLNNIITIEKEPKQNRATKSEVLRLLMLGQITPGKGHMDALQAISKLGEQVKKIHLTIVGSAIDDLYYQKLTHFVGANSLSDVVVFSEHTENPLDEILRHDLLLMCSQSEAYGRVTEEAMRLGVPVIGKNSGNTRFLVKDGVSGFLYDNVDELYQVLRKLIANPILVFELSGTTHAFSKTSYKVTTTEVLRTFSI